MKLLFDKDLANNYKSKSQAIRVMSESWVINNLFCPCCGKNSLTHLKNNTPVSDFECNNCGEFFELKSKGKAIGRKINDGAYETMINRITSNTNPNLIVLEYNNLEVINVELIPKYFFTPEIIEKRKPLGLNAKRTGWIGCNIVYGNIPHQGRITIIKDGTYKDNNDIILEYTSTKKLQIESIIKRGWLFDV